jgi:hypothetical protein
MKITPMLPVMVPGCARILLQGAASHTVNTAQRGGHTRLLWCQAAPGSCCRAPVAGCLRPAQTQSATWRARHVVQVRDTAAASRTVLATAAQRNRAGIHVLTPTHKALNQWRFCSSEIHRGIHAKHMQSTVQLGHTVLSQVCSAHRSAWVCCAGGAVRVSSRPHPLTACCVLRHDMAAEQHGQHTACCVLRHDMAAASSGRTYISFNQSMVHL